MNIITKTKTTIKIYKYWKPKGVLSSLNINDNYNIIKYGQIKQENLINIFNNNNKENKENNNNNNNKEDNNELLLIGRLDKDSSGLLLLTNSNLIIKKLINTYNNKKEEENNNKEEEKEEEGYGSKYPKIYYIITNNYVSNDLLNKLRNGISIKTIGRRKKNPLISYRNTLPCKIERIKENLFIDNNEIKLEQKKRTNELYFMLREGRNRQIRKMLGAVGHGVNTLCRISIGNVTLEGLNGPGDILPLTEIEKQSLGIIEDS